MNTKAVRIYGVKDLRLEEFELPTMRDDEIEARIVTDSLCMSTYKAVSYTHLDVYKRQIFIILI